MFKEGLFKGKRILVTGGGTGLGKEIAAKYLELGAELWIAGRRGAVLEQTARELMSAHGGKSTSTCSSRMDGRATRPPRKPSTKVFPFAKPNAAHVSRR